MTSTVIVGAGIVGLATAWELVARDTDHQITVVEKQAGPAQHQTGRNSGVIHAGVYYKPGSAKAELCLRGRSLLMDFATQFDIPFQVCGKLVLATSRSEIGRLNDLADRCSANGVAIERCGPESLQDHEPHAHGVAALWVRSTGIIDYAEVSRVLVRELTNRGVVFRFDTEVVGGTSTHERVSVRTSRGELVADRVLNCAGLHADRISHLLSPPTTLPMFDPQQSDNVQIVPFRGEYFSVTGTSAQLVRGLIYPVPDPQFPFLGVHLTRGIDGHVHAGPNAVFAFAREGYNWRTLNRKDTTGTLGFPGFQKLARQHWRYGLREMDRSLRSSAFAKSLQRLVPGIDPKDLQPAPAGVRAQAVRADGTLVDDFLFRSGPRSLHVLNAPSPAATASFAIAKVIADQLD